MMTQNLCCLVWLSVIASSNAYSDFFFKNAANNIIESNGLIGLTNSNTSYGHTFYSSPLKPESSPFFFSGGHGFAFVMATENYTNRTNISHYSLPLNSVHDDDALHLDNRVFEVALCSPCGFGLSFDVGKLAYSSRPSAPLLTSLSKRSYDRMILSYQSNSTPFTDPKGSLDLSNTEPGLAFSLKAKKRRVLQIKTAAAVSASVLISLILLSICYCIHKVKKKQASQEDDINGIIEVEPLHMKYNSIRVATGNFTNDRKVGQGGFGHVYKGTLESGQDVAVKRLSENSGQGIAEFMTEVRLCTKLQHRAVVQLLGYCISKKERILVYEFLPNSSLDKFLFDATKRMSLNWETRFKIIYEVAKGLLYLHEDSRLKIVHRDLKWSNILLDESMNPKISDFGLAKLLNVDQTQDATNKIVGTCGYMAPEYITTGHYSIKSDVYSFGIMILELVSGQRNYMNRAFLGEALLHRAWRSWNESTPQDLVDEMLADNYSRKEMTICVQMGLLCIQEEPTKRPNMTTIVAALRGQSSILPWPSPPEFFGITGLNSVAAAEVSVCETANITELYPR